MYILTDNDLKIIDSRNEPWKTPGEYTDDCFKIIICEVPEGKEVDYIESSGEVSTEDFEVQGKQITCNHIYRNAIVIFKNIPEVI